MTRSTNVFTLFSAASFLAVFISSCGNGEEQKINSTAKSDIAKATDSKYISFKDADACDPGWKKENTLIVHAIGDVDDMHPTNGTISANTQEILLYTQVHLIRSDYETLGLYPYLAKALPQISADELTFTYELRDDMTWDDGTTISAEDVVFSMKANKCPLTNNPHAKPSLSNVKEVMVDPAAKNSVKVLMKNKYIQNISLWTDVAIMQRSYFDPGNVLAKYSFAQFDDKSFKADANKDLKDWGLFFNDPKFSRDPQYLVGAGPYKVESWDAGQSFTLVKKQKHWTAGKEGMFNNAYPDKIIYKINKDPNSTKLDFKNQVFDVTGYMDAKVLEELQADPNFNKNYNSKFVDTYNYSYAAMNMRPDGIKHKKLFVDKKVRRAMAYLFPLNNINKILSSGLSKRMVTCTSPLSPDFNADLSEIPFDVEAAKKLLAEAGWKDTDGDQVLDKVIDGEKVKFEFNFQYMTTTKNWEIMAQQVSEAMGKAGVKANLTPVEYNVQRERALNHDFDLFLGSWAGSAAPEDHSQIWAVESWSSKGSNYTGFGNSESDALIKQINQTVVDSLRTPLVKKFQEIVYDEQPYVFMFAALRKVAIHKRFGNQKVYFERPGILFNNLKLLPCSKKNATQP